MPFKSKAQQKWMFVHHPEMAEEWAHKTKNIKKLPDHARHKKEGSLGVIAASFAVQKVASDELRLKFKRKEFHGLKKKEK